MYRHFCQCRVNSKSGFHFKAGNVFTPAAHVVLLAVDEVEEAVVIESANVAGVEPHIAHQFQGVLRTTPVDRKSVVEGKSVSVRVEHGGRRCIKKKKQIT